MSSLTSCELVVRLLLMQMESKSTFDCTVLYIGVDIQPMFISYTKLGMVGAPLY